MCGIIGIQGIDDVVNELVGGLIHLQHRGQDACGIHTSDDQGRIYVKKGLGLVQEVLKEEHFRRLRGSSGIGHVRYATVGAGDSADIQPFYESGFFIASLAHNGNLTNFSDLRDNQLCLASGCDGEALLKVVHSNTVSLMLKDRLAASFAASGQDSVESVIESLQLPTRFDMSSDCAVDAVLEAIRGLMSVCQGSYSAVMNIPGFGMLGFKDPYGIKPLSVATKQTGKGTAFCFASEDVAFQLPLGFDFVEELAPGSAFLAMKDGRVIKRKFSSVTKPHLCIFERIYFASVCSSLFGVSTSEFRFQSGKLNGQAYLDAGFPVGAGTIFSPVPSASERCGAGFCEVTGIQSRNVYVRNNYMKRGFILPHRKAREYNAMLKLPIDFSVLKNVENLVLGDDSVVRGDTSRNIVYRVRDEAKRRGLPLKNVYLVVMAPQNLHPCPYGIDMPVDKELIASKMGGDRARIAEYIGVDGLLYMGVPVLGRILSKLSKDSDPKYCDACFSGIYPTGLTAQDIERLKNERIADKGSEY
ncbi:hypothetical protein KY363_05745 [Candidatus Woesearchaeota archaeon]|nr:hypothetical protein [Candidatus Woesearchaeota archaeon]